MKANPRGPGGPSLVAALLLAFAITLPACDRSRTQVLLTRGTPEATPTSARLVATSASPVAAAVTPQVGGASPSTTVTRAAAATATSQPSATPAAPRPTATPVIPATATPSPSPTMTPTSTPRPAATATAQVRVHVVRAGETLALIARKYATTATAIARYNGLTNPNRIYVGQRLIIP